VRIRAGDRRMLVNAFDEDGVSLPVNTVLRVVVANQTTKTYAMNAEGHEGVSITFGHWRMVRDTKPCQSSSQQSKSLPRSA